MPHYDSPLVNPPPGSLYAYLVRSFEYLDISARKFAVAQCADPAAGVIRDAARKAAVFCGEVDEKDDSRTANFATAAFAVIVADRVRETYANYSQRERAARVIAAAMIVSGMRGTQIAEMLNEGAPRRCGLTRYSIASAWKAHQNALRTARWGLEHVRRDSEHVHALLCVRDAAKHRFRGANVAHNDIL